MCVIVCVLTLFFMHSSVHAHFGCLCFLATVNRVILNIAQQVSLCYADFFPFGWTPSSGIGALLLKSILLDCPIARACQNLLRT